MDFVTRILQVLIICEAIYILNDWGYAHTSRSNDGLAVVLPDF